MPNWNLWLSVVRLITRGPSAQGLLIQPVCWISSSFLTLCASYSRAVYPIIICSQKPGKQRGSVVKRLYPQTVLIPEQICLESSSTHAHTNFCGFATAAVYVVCSVPPPELRAFAQEFFPRLSVQVFQKTPAMREWGLGSGSPDRWWIVLLLPKVFKKQKDLAVGWLRVKGTQTKLKIECIHCSSVILKVEVSASIRHKEKGCLYWSTLFYHSLGSLCFGFVCVLWKNKVNTSINNSAAIEL